jgi:hypothetical protein
MRWSYKTVHYALKKEGLLGSAFLDESEIEQSLNEYGKAGWELVSLLETTDGVIGVFKQPLDLGRNSFTPVAAATPAPVGEPPSAAKPQVRREMVKRVVQEASIVPTISTVDDYEVVEDQDEIPGEPLQVDVGSIKIE